MANIGIIGSGSWGTAISNVLADNGHNVILWSFLKEEYEMLTNRKIKEFDERKYLLHKRYRKSSFKY